MFKFEGNQKLWIIGSNHPVIVIARTEFFTGKSPRYCVQSETAIPGKNVSEDWINEDRLTDVEPVPEPTEEEKALEKSVTTNSKKGIRSTMKKG